MFDLEIVRWLHHLALSDTLLLELIAYVLGVHYLLRILHVLNLHSLKVLLKIHLLLLPERWNYL